MKARTNVSIDKSLLESARLHKLILSSLLEEAIKKQLRIVEEEEWREKNSQNISSYNNYITKNGVFSDGVRLF
jgi:antitoxin CcdA